MFFCPSILIDGEIEQFDWIQIWLHIYLFGIYLFIYLLFIRDVFYFPPTNE